jgi:hypothetical protein
MAQITSASIIAKSAAQADERREFQGLGHLDVLKLGEHTVGVATFEPGWRWSTNVKPIAGTDSCQAPHLSYVVSGRMMIRSDDGTEVEVGPGQVVSITPGHDAWIIGDEACVQVDFIGAGNYAKK